MSRFGSCVPNRRPSHPISSAPPDDVAADSTARHGGPQWTRAAGISHRTLRAHVDYGGAGHRVPVRRTLAHGGSAARPETSNTQITLEGQFSIMKTWVRKSL